MPGGPQSCKGRPRIPNVRIDGTCRWLTMPGGLEAPEGARIAWPPPTAAVGAHIRHARRDSRAGLALFQSSGPEMITQKVEAFLDPADVRLFGLFFQQQGSSHWKNNFRLARDSGRTVRGHPL